ncbi:transcription factor bHLH96-like [Oryza glaberrima]|uniref:BHLH domain-containing protein n=1 Tax=Oryza barthii TaxID=65489 RepID=A0A0D3FZJ5_9ORYZ|nr:transcription factor bHLH96-like [Oryza glaberrima]XP_052151281.1 transcription factor bHLH96-like [Oryza glaberrima]
MALDTLCSAGGDVLIYDTFNASAAAAAAVVPPASFLFGNNNAGGAAGTETRVQVAAGAVPEVDQLLKQAQQPGRRKRRRRARSCKSREDAESQRMTHIAVERNRRRQMNEYLAVLRSLMPESYVHRGDQASIVGGAIDFVKELEQLLQSLEAQKRTLLMQPPPPPQQQREPKCDAADSTSAADQETPAAAAADGPPFARFFTYPQYVWCHNPAQYGGGGGGAAAENRAGVADIEVSLVETHASIRVMAARRPGQLLKMVAGLQALRLTVLHLNVTALGSLALYSISVKVEEGCGMATVDDIAAAVHHVLCIIDAEAASQMLLAGEASG